MDKAYVRDFHSAIKAYLRTRASYASNECIGELKVRLAEKINDTIDQEAKHIADKVLLIVELGLRNLIEEENRTGSPGLRSVGLAPIYPTNPLRDGLEKRQLAEKAARQAEEVQKKAQQYMYDLTADDDKKPA